MAARVVMKILQGPLAGQTLAFQEHNVLLFGRDPRCQLAVPQDLFVSRHHFMIELNPPRVALRDLNSLNGAIINGVQYGGRRHAQHGDIATEPIVLLDGDRIQIGQTLIQLEIHAGEPLLHRLNCTVCARELVVDDPDTHPGDYLCDDCGASAQENPGVFLKTMMHHGLTVRGQQQQVAGYKIGERLGQGGMGAVYLAVDRETAEQVVVKILHSHLAATKSNRETFLREMRLLNVLRHANIVQYRDYGAAGSTFFFVVEYCNAGSLARKMALQGGRIHWQEALPLFRQVLDGLAFAHSQNIVHRDLKPDNFLLHQALTQTTAKIGDFGLAKVYTLAGMTQLTQPGEYAGSFMFMARDQLENFKFATPAADVWSAAATFYNALTGKFPREYPPGRDPIDVIMDDQIIPLSHWNVDVHPKLAAAIQRGLESDPQKRWQDAREFLAALQ